jgi:predicted GIY-YIG superfamily endonuclease
MMTQQMQLNEKKKLKSGGAWKIGLIEKDNPDWKDLYPDIVR